MVKSLKQICNRFLWVVLVIGCCGVILGQFGRISEAFDSINLLLPIWVAAGFSGLVGLAMQRSRRRRAGLWLSLAAAILISSVVAMYPATLDANHPVRDGHSLKIITFNLWKRNASPQVAADWIRREKPDIVVLIEAKEHSSQVPAMLEDMYPYRVSCHRIAFCSTIILSRQAPTSAVPLARGDAENRQALSAAMMRFGDGADRPAILAVHLPRPYPLGSQARELALLDDAMGKISTRQLILLGDFNSNSFTFTLRRLAERHGLTPLEAWAPTWPTPSSALPVPAFIAIDHIFVGPGWTVSDVRRGPDLGSDHYPLVATLRRSET